MIFSLYNMFRKWDKVIILVLKLKHFFLQCGGDFSKDFHKTVATTVRP